MRVAFLSVGDTGRLTGGYRYNARVVGGLRARGVEVDEVTPCGASAEEQSAAAASGEDPLRDHRAYDVIVADALARIVISAHLDDWRADRPVVALVHELQGVAGPRESASVERAHEEPLLRSDALVAVSDHGARILRSRGVPAERVRVVHPGSDTYGIDAKATPARDVPGRPRVLCVAQWIPRKGILELVRAWRTLPAGYAVLELTGENDVDPDYSAGVRETVGNDASVVVRGPVGDAEVRAAYASADVFALPSRYEGYGVVYAEALRFGLPIVACDVGPVPEVVGPEAALLVPPDDPEALAVALERVTGDPALRARMSRAARRRAAGLPRWEDTVRGFHEVLRERVRAGGPGRNPVESSGDLHAREQNRRSWNAAVPAHESHRGGLAGFLRGGGSTLFPEEERLLGDLRGMNVLHLQCNAGGDTLSLASRGATVTGVDLGDAAILAARDLSRETGLPATFVRSDLYEWLEGAAREGPAFDAVFASYGVVCWLSDLDPWAGGIHSILKPGGRFVLVDFHPAAEVFGRDWSVIRSYPSGGERTVLQEGVGDYVGDSAGGLTPWDPDGGERGFKNPEPANLFRWGLGEAVTALAGAGLRIERLEEYPYANGERHFAGMREGEGRRMYPPARVPAVPLMYGLRARR